MAKPISNEQKEMILELINSGLSHQKISNKIGVSRITICRYALKLKTGYPSKRELNKIKLQEFKDTLANDRLTMFRYEVAEKHNIHVSYVTKLTLGHPLESKFKSNHLTPRKKKLIIVPQQKTKKVAKTAFPKLKPKPTIKKKDVKKLGQSEMEKGFAKVKKTEKIFKTKPPKELRSVPILDSKNTIKFVELDDPRTNDQIRKEFKESELKKLKSLAS